MSRIGKNPVSIPSGVEAKIDGQHVEVKGPKGTLSLDVPEPITVVLEGSEIKVSRPDDNRRSRALHGLSRSLINNMVIGVSEGYTIKMEIFGVGYRVQAKGKGLEFSLGYSHTIPIEPPGIDKQKVGQIAANIRRLRKDDPYKGKGIRYEGEQIRRKVGKTGK